MINLKIRTEYSFRYAYGKIKDIISKQEEYAAITDRFTTFGHIPFWKECRKQGKKCILGVELAFVNELDKQIQNYRNYKIVTLIAKNADGLSEIYKLVSKSTKQKYYINRLEFKELSKLSDNIIAIITDSFMLKHFAVKNRGNVYYGVSPITNYNDFCRNKAKFVAISDNIYDLAQHKKLYEIILAGNNYQTRTELSHILNKDEWCSEVNFLTDRQKTFAINNIDEIVSKIEQFDFPQAELPSNYGFSTLRELCENGKNDKKISWNDEYEQRLSKELDIIDEKNFGNYFYLVWDLVNFAKKHMLVGPARGSSAGSLVCYLLGITDVDPLKFGLIFERFIDVNRADLPDIDIDFQDTKRELLFDYLKKKYGEDCVSKLGTVSKYKPKSILTELAKVLNIAPWEIKDLKDAIIERSGGDARASDCINDTFTELQIGRDFLKKYPKLEYSKFIESHNRHFGKHAAGIVVADKPLENYCSLDYNFGSCQLDKIDAETVNLLKMDCLGLRTLSVIQDCLDEIGKDRYWIVNYPIDDQKAFDVINSRKFYGIFQFEGSALIQISKQIEITKFEDISAITALARPGPLVSGGTANYVKAKNSGKVEYLPHCEEWTKETFGVIVYQEQVMNIVRHIGNFSWADTSTIRKAMSKSLGEEFIQKMTDKFVNGAKENGIDEKTALIIWRNIYSMGSWAFNKSHSISYGLISYWCMVLKAYFPLEFALATLKNAKDDEQVISILKELVNEGYEYKPFDYKLSCVDWSVKDNKLIGGFTNIKGVGSKKAEKLIEKRNNNKDLTAAEKRLIFNAETPYDKIFEFKENFQDFYDNWQIFVKTRPVYIKDIEEDMNNVRFLGKVVETNLRDVNEAINIKKRGGEEITDGCLKYLDLKIADDTDIIPCRISRELYEKFGEDILNKHKIGDHYLICGKSLKGFRFLMIKNIVKITLDEINQKIKDYLE